MVQQSQVLASLVAAGDAAALCAQRWAEAAARARALAKAQHAQHEQATHLLSQSAAAAQEQRAALAAAYADTAKFEEEVERLKVTPRERESQLLASHAEEVGSLNPFPILGLRSDRMPYIQRRLDIYQPEP